MYRIWILKTRLLNCKSDESDRRISAYTFVGGWMRGVGISVKRVCVCLCDMFGSVWVAALIRFPAGWILSFAAVAAANSPHHIVATCRSSLDQIRLPRDIRLWKSNWVRIASYRWLSEISSLPLLFFFSRLVSMMPTRPQYNWQSLFTNCEPLINFSWPLLNEFNYIYHINKLQSTFSFLYYYLYVLLYKPHILFI